MKRTTARFGVSILANLPLFVVLSGFTDSILAAQDSGLPHLEKRGVATQLVVDGKPFLMLAGQVANSSSSSLEYMKPLWPQLAAMSLNTVLTPISWELVEPTEGKFDFTLIDGLLAQAREQHLHIVFLWFGSWKGGAFYPPLWVKQDLKRFPRVIHNDKVNDVYVLTPLASTTCDVEARAFSAVMQHLHEVDARDHTVLMMQVENEIGLLGDTRDHSPEANRAFASTVPEELMNYLKSHLNSLDPALRAPWVEQGEKISGTWTQVFGNTPRADEIFMAWYIARYVNAVAAKGKAAYNVPMYVNTWLAQTEDTPPGDYPSGGPEPWVIDIWKAAGSSIDFYAPDLYAPEFASWCKRYHRADNPLFIPEARGGMAAAVNVFFAVGEHAALGFSPYDVPSMQIGLFDQEAKSSDHRTPDLRTSYTLLAQLWPLLQDQQAKGNVHGFVLDKWHSALEFNMNGYLVKISLNADSGFGLITATGSDEFVGAGAGFNVSFTTRSPGPPHVAIAYVDEGKFQDGKWVPGRRLNGGESDRLFSEQPTIEKVRLFRFE